jgi:hypothetical protein
MAATDAPDEYCANSGLKLIEYGLITLGFPFSN